MVFCAVFSGIFGDVCYGDNIRDPMANVGCTGFFLQAFQGPKGYADFKCLQPSAQIERVSAKKNAAKL